MKLIEKMGKFMGRYDHIPKRGSGLTATEYKALGLLGIIQFHKLPTKTGKIPANPNHFTITDYGRQVIRLGLNHQISTADILMRVSKNFDDTYEQIMILKHKLELIEQTISSSRELLGTMKNSGSTKSLPKLSVKEIIKEAELGATNEYKSGPLFCTEVYFRALEPFYSDEEINSLLYSLYERDLLELQMGTKKGRGVRSLSGKYFHWGKLKEGV